jgi:transcriptional regulator with XRE-family HTH domain
MASRRLKKSVHSERYRQLLQKLKRARQRSGLTQAQVAAKMGQPQSFVSKCESGERRIDVLELERFAELYRQPLSLFLEPVRGRLRSKNAKAR